MLIVCPSCTTSYDVEPASLLPGGRTVRCLRCRTAWHAETARHTNVESDSAQRTAGHPVHVNRAAGGERIASLDGFELIREQAHNALNAIRSRCREDHTRVLHRLGAPDAIPPSYADKPLAEAAKLPLQPRLPDAGWDANTRIKISRAFAEALADVTNEMPCRNCADELLDSEQLRTGNEAGSFAVVVDDEQPAEGDPSSAAVDEAQEGGWMASAADKPNTAWAATLTESPANEPNESAGLEELPTPVDLDSQDQATAPVAVDVEDLSLAPADFVKGRPRIQINTGDSTDCPDGPREEIQPVAKRRRRARPWSPPRWPMSRLQTVILVLLVVDCILIGWRPEIVRALPQTSSFYKLVGLSVNGLAFSFYGVATTMEQHEGVPVLVVEGKIVNGARTAADVPPLKFIVRTANRQEIYSWTAVPSRTLLAPGEAVPFRTELASPPPDTDDVLLRFVDYRDIVAAER